MKLTKRALSLFPSYAQGPFPETMQRIAAYAAQNPGLEYGNYCSDWRDADGRRAYFGEARRITRQLADVRQALHDAYYADATDADVIAASASAFSGRLTVSATGIDYCTGQYWPTEYRAACAAVLERAARIARFRNEQATESNARHAA
jgi:hypothetical protein